MVYERASVFEVPTLAPESLAAPGTPVTPDTRLEAIGFQPRPRFENRRFRPNGYKVDTLIVPGKEWSEFRVDGIADYRNIVYPLASVFGAPDISTPGGGTTSRDWVFGKNATSFDARQTYTVICGSAVEAEQYNRVEFTELGLTFSREAVELSGAAMGQAVNESAVYLPDNEVYLIDFSGTVSGGTYTVTVDTATTGPIDYNATAAELQLAIQNLPTVGAGNVVVKASGNDFLVIFCGALAGTGPTMTVDDSSITGGGTVTESSVQNDAAVTAITAEPIVPGSVNVYADDTHSNFGTTQLLRVLRAELRIASIWNPLWVMDSGESSYAASVEIPLDITLKMKLVADSVGKGYLTTIRNGATKFVRIEAEGPNIESNINHLFRLDFAGKVEMPDDMAYDDVTTIDWTFRAVHSSAWGKFVEATVTNTLTGL